MDFLQLALISLVVFLAVILSVLGVQVFIVLEKLKKDLDRLDKFIQEVDSQSLDDSKRAEKVLIPPKPKLENDDSKLVKRIFKRRFRI